MTPAAFRSAANTELRARVRRFEDVAELDAERLMTWFETAGLEMTDAQRERENARARDDYLAEQQWHRERER